jgi:hypothetical protein
MNPMLIAERRKVEFIRLSKPYPFNANFLMAKSTSLETYIAEDLHVQCLQKEAGFHIPETGFGLILCKEFMERHPEKYGLTANQEKEALFILPSRRVPIKKNEK